MENFRLSRERIYFSDGTFLDLGRIDVLLENLKIRVVHDVFRLQFYGGNLLDRLQLDRSYFFHERRGAEKQVINGRADYRDKKDGQGKAEPVDFSFFFLD
jgi:hypothetical protein